MHVVAVAFARAVSYFYQFKDEVNAEEQRQCWRAAKFVKVLDNKHSICVCLPYVLTVSLLLL